MSCKEDGAGSCSGGKLNLYRSENVEIYAIFQKKSLHAYQASIIEW